MKSNQLHEYEETKNITKKDINYPSDYYSDEKLDPLASDEPGFTGDPSTWFSDDEYNKQFEGILTMTKSEDPYFGSYSHFGIHEDMLKDEVRTKSYMIACKNNAEQFKDKIVLDVGCGTGILSIFAARAGAKQVIGIDNAEIANFAKEIIEKNGYSDRITILKGKVEELTLPVDHVDIIISEWMGYFLLYESMLDTIIYARDKYLVSDGLILPDRVTLNLIAIEDSQYKQNKYGFWVNVYGVDMECIREVSLAEPLVDTVEGTLAMSSIGKVLDIDLYKVRVEDLVFASEFELRIDHTDTIYAFVGWFDTYFNKLKKKVRFTTSPYSRATHWKQVIMYLPEPIKAKKNGILKGVMGLSRDKTNFRHINIKMTYKYEDNETKIEGSKMYKLR